MLLSEQMRLTRDQHVAERDALHQRQSDILNRATTRPDKQLLASEQRDFDALKAQKRAIDEVIRGDNERIEELLVQESREANAAEHRAKYGTLAFVTGEPGPYRPDGGPSFFLDLRSAARGDSEAIARLARNQSQAIAEKRAGDMTSVAGAGGEFAPPAWMVQQYVTLARPGRVTADLLTSDTLPAGVSSINLPKVASGTTTGVQATQNSAVSDTAMTTTSVSSGITTVAGKQIISLQLVEQSGIPFDQVVLKDLAADHAERLDLQVLSGAGSGGELQGILGVSGVNTVTYTTTQPSVTSTTNANSFLFQIVSAKNKIETGILRSPTAIIMHTRRWNWVLNALDTTNRPLVVPQGQQFNGPAVSTEPRAEGSVGVMAGIDVYTDPNLPTTVSTNQDQVIVCKRDELYLWESSLKAEAFDATYADQLSLLLRVYSYAASIPHRRPKAITVISGTGLVDPGL